MLRQASAQRWQDSAQCWQWSIVCFAHSVLQASQTSAQSEHTACIFWSPRAIDAAASRQTSAHSISRAMHCAIDFGSSS